MFEWPDILLRGFESRELDSKAPMDWNEDDKRACCELTKDVLAMANSGGGLIVIGVRDPSTDYSLEGLSVEQAKSFETTRVNRFINNYADPPLNILVHRRDYQGKTFIVLEIPAFPDTPHVCQKDYPGTLVANTLYVRTDNNESAPIRSSSDFRKLIERAVRNRADQLLSSFHAILTHGQLPVQQTDLDNYERQIEHAARRLSDLNPHREKAYAYRITAFFPNRFERARFGIGSLHEMAQNASVGFRGWPFIFYSLGRPAVTYVHEDALETFLPDAHPFTGGDSLHYWRLESSGPLYAVELRREDTFRSVGGGHRMLDFDRISCEAAEAIYCLSKLYNGRLSPSDEVLLRLELTDMKGRRLGSSNPARYMHDELWISRTDRIRYESARSLAEWQAGLVDHALEICRYIFERFQWTNPNLSESRKLIENMLARRG